MDHATFRANLLCSSLFEMRLVRSLLFQILIEPLNRTFHRKFALLAIDPVVRDVRNRDVLLLRSGHAIVCEFCLSLIAEQFFLLGNDKAI